MDKYMKHYRVLEYIHPEKYVNYKCMYNVSVNYKPDHPPGQNPHEIF